jgi:hypothetical protein
MTRTIRVPRAFLAAGAVVAIGGGVLAGVAVAAGSSQDITCTITDNMLSCPLPQATPVTSTVTETATETTTATETVTATVTEPGPTTTITEPGPTTTVTVPGPTVTQTVTTTATVTATPSSTTTTAAPQTKNCAPTPSACGYPDATNTGTTGTLTASACPATITAANTVVENKSFTNCQLSIAATGVIVRNVKVTSSAVAGAAITVRPGASASFSNVDVAGVSASQPVQYAILVSSHAATGLGRVTIDRAHIHDCIDCISADNTDITNSYFHAMRHPAGAHVDPIQCGSGDGCGLLVRHNTVFNEFSSTSAVALFADFGIPRNSTIDNNLLAGGGYVITGGNGVSGANSGKSTGIRITNNRFAKILYPYNAPADCTNPNLHGCYGDITEWRASSSNVATGNVDDATGNPITLN